MEMKGRGAGGNDTEREMENDIKETLENARRHEEREGKGKSTERTDVQVGRNMYVWRDSEEKPVRRIKSPHYLQATREKQHGNKGEGGECVLWRLVYRDKLWQTHTHRASSKRV
jgi:hypothetical protein